ncbi:OapA family protein [Teredinibacter haidensis]|uniref:OapA family protein n=1 Tax=Teredinibacter haidensis TaxID=2731755 RepID=UPI000B08E0D2|nr:peptidoglycan DD-metalloendopeptidase family protein [Teredinibacter haidensis]
MQPVDMKRKKRFEVKRKSVKAVLKQLPRMHLAAVAALSFCLGTFLMLPSKETEAKRHSQAIPIPSLQSIQEPFQATPELEDFAPIEEPDNRLINQKVKPGDNLSLIFKRAGFTDRDMMALLQAENGKKLASLYPGHHLEFLVGVNGALQKLSYIQDRLNSFAYTRTAGGYHYSEIQRKPDIILSTRSATITESLFLAGKKAQLDDKLVMELAGIFGWDIDFALDIRENDSFKVLFEESFLDGDKIGNGNILAAEFTNRGKSFRAVRYEDINGNTQYYTPTGDTMRKEFLRTPIDFARISSHFNLSRKHPVLNKIRAHKGTDYAAARGTPIKAAGDGKVTFAGRKGGYGNVVIIQHGQTYKTFYAHISKFRKGIHKGSRVKQGQVIAYVGSTGLATGPHLHYEFHVNGAVRNPLTVKLPKAKAVPEAELQRFYQHTQPLLAELTPEAPSTKVAVRHTNSDTKKL